MSYEEWEHHDRVWAEIDLQAAVDNMEHMHQNLRPGTKMIAVIKTDGYGHGAVRLAEKLEALEYVWGYAVATYEEAKELRTAGRKKPILILGYTFPYCYEGLAQEEIRPACFREDMLEALSAAGEKAGKAVRIHVAVDTAMSRIGVRPDDEGLAFVKKALDTPYVDVEGIFTHFSKADETDPANTRRQIAEFTAFCKRIETELGYRVPIQHCSNSAGIVRFPEANLDLVRAGITLYGLWPSAEVPQDVVPLRPVLSLYSHVAYVKTVPAGTPVSYGGTYVTKKDTVLATIPVGYGDGYARGLSNKGYVLIHGQKAPICGRVCMDQFMVDVSDIPGVTDGDLVTMVGRDGEETITLEMLGDLSGRFNYEFACDLGKRIPRVYR